MVNPYTNRSRNITLLRNRGIQLNSNSTILIANKNNEEEILPDEFKTKEIEKVNIEIARLEEKKGRAKNKEERIILNNEIKGLRKGLEKLSHAEGYTYDYNSVKEYSQDYAQNKQDKADYKEKMKKAENEFNKKQSDELLKWEREMAKDPSNVMIKKSSDGSYVPVKYNKKEEPKMSTFVFKDYADMNKTIKVLEKDSKFENLKYPQRETIKNYGEKSLTINKPNTGFLKKTQSDEATRLYNYDTQMSGKLPEKYREQYESLTKMPYIGLKDINEERLNKRLKEKEITPSGRFIGLSITGIGAVTGNIPIAIVGITRLANSYGLSVRIKQSDRRRYIKESEKILKRELTEKEKNDILKYGRNSEVEKIIRNSKWYYRVPRGVKEELRNQIEFAIKNPELTYGFGKILQYGTGYGGKALNWGAKKISLSESKTLAGETLLRKGATASAYGLTTGYGTYNQYKNTGDWAQSLGGGLAGLGGTYTLQKSIEGWNKSKQIDLMRKRLKEFKTIDEWERSIKDGKHWKDADDWQKKKIENEMVKYRAEGLRPVDVFDKMLIEGSKGRTERFLRTMLRIPTSQTEYYTPKIREIIKEQRELSRLKAKELRKRTNSPNSEDMKGDNWVNLREGEELVTKIGHEDFLLKGRKLRDSTRELLKQKIPRERLKNLLERTKGRFRDVLKIDKAKLEYKKLIWGLRSRLGNIKGIRLRRAMKKGRQKIIDSLEEKYGFRKWGYLGEPQPKGRALGKLKWLNRKHKLKEWVSSKLDRIRINRQKKNILRRKRGEWTSKEMRDWKDLGKLPSLSEQRAHLRLEKYYKKEDPYKTGVNLKNVAKDSDEELKIRRILEEERLVAMGSASHGKPSAKDLDLTTDKRWYQIKSDTGSERIRKKFESRGFKVEDTPEAKAKKEKRLLEEEALNNDYLRNKQAKIGEDLRPQIKEVKDSWKLEDIEEAYQDRLQMRKEEFSLNDKKVEAHTHEWNKSHPFTDKTERDPITGLRRISENEQFRRKVEGVTKLDRVTKDLPDMINMKIKRKLLKSIKRIQDENDRIFTGEKISQQEFNKVLTNTNKKIQEIGDNLKLDLKESNLKKGSKEYSLYIKGKISEYNKYIAKIMEIYKRYDLYKSYQKYNNYRGYKGYDLYEKYNPYVPYKGDDTYNPYKPYKPYKPYAPYKAYKAYKPYSPYKGYKTEEPKKPIIWFHKKRRYYNSNKEKEGYRKYNLLRVNDPFLRMTGKAKYSGDMLQLMRRRYGNYGT